MRSRTRASCPRSRATWPCRGRSARNAWARCPARACGGELVGADRLYSGVSTDTRTLNAGDLFVALRGPRFNANDFVTAAETAGAAGAVVDTRTDRPLPQIVVRDTQDALTRAAAAWRAQFSIPLVGVAGSNGKERWRFRPQPVS